MVALSIFFYMRKTSKEEKMKLKSFFVFIVTLGLIISWRPSQANTLQEGEKGAFIPAFPLLLDDLKLERLAQSFSPWDKVGRRFAFIGTEGGSLEAWAYPLKLIRQFELSFLLGSSTQPIRSRDIVRRITVTPAATIFHFAFQSFSLQAIYVASVNEPGGLILLALSSDEPLTVVVSFLPVLQPMWPAGIGGQYAYWDKDLRAYLISEPTRKNHAYVGSPAAQGISYTPAHMLADTPSEFIIKIEKPEEVRGKLIPLAVAGGKGKREDIRQVYEKLISDPEKVYREAVEHYQRLRAKTCQLITPRKEINLALEWAKISLDNLLVNNPDLGYGMIAGLGPSGTGGRPGFGWFFGGDAYINSLALTSLGNTDEARSAIAFTQKWQRADGKMAHELSQAAAYIDWFKDYPYAYIHGDTTPYYLVALWDYYLHTGDLKFLQQSWPSVCRAFDWCLTTDEDGDGLMDNRRAGLGALEYGALTDIQTDIYLAAVWVKALQAMKAMAQRLKDENLTEKAAKILTRALVSFEKFWDEELDSYVYAFTREGERVKELTPWPAVALMWQIGQPERRERTLQQLFSSLLTSDWGVRSLAVTSKFYGPLNYNYGAIWPFLTGFVATAEFGHYFFYQAFPLLLSAANHFFDQALGHPAEVFSGSRYLSPQEAVPHQGFSATGFVLPLFRGLLGLETNLGEGIIRFQPQFPANWEEVRVKNIRLGDEIYEIYYKRREGKVKLSLVKKNSPQPEKKSEEKPKREERSLLSPKINFVFAPIFGPGVKPREVKVNGASVAFNTQETTRSSQIEVIISLEEETNIEVWLEETVEILPPTPTTSPGEEDQGLKVICFEKKGKEISLVGEAPAGHSYILPLYRPELVVAVEGAELSTAGLVIKFPEAQTPCFQTQKIRLRLK